MGAAAGGLRGGGLLLLDPANGRFLRSSSGSSSSSSVSKINSCSTLRSEESWRIMVVNLCRFARSLNLGFTSTPTLARSKSELFRCATLLSTDTALACVLFSARDEVKLGRMSPKITRRQSTKLCTPLYCTFYTMRFPKSMGEPFQSTKFMRG